MSVALDLAVLFVSLTVPSADASSVLLTNLHTKQAYTQSPPSHTTLTGTHMLGFGVCDTACDSGDRDRLLERPGLVNRERPAADLPRGLSARSSFLFFCFAAFAACFASRCFLSIRTLYASLI